MGYSWKRKRASLDMSAHKEWVILLYVSSRDLNHFYFYLPIMREIGAFRYFRFTTTRRRRRRRVISNLVQLVERSCIRFPLRNTPTPLSKTLHHLLTIFLFVWQLLHVTLSIFDDEKTPPSIVYFFFPRFSSSSVIRNLSQPVRYHAYWLAFRKTLDLFSPCASLMFSYIVSWRYDSFVAFTESRY